MPLLPCPHCDQKISVSISQAGTPVTCTNCQQVVEIPKLGELRQLASQADADNGAAATRTARGAVSDTNSGRRVLFAGLLAIAGVAAIVGLFCLVRYLAITVPATTENHVEEIERMYKQVSAAQLVREWQQMEKYGLDVASPYGYKKLAIEKEGWGRKGLACLAVIVTSIGFATVLGLTEAKRKS